MVYKVHDALTLNQRAGSLLGEARMGLEYLLFRTGPLTMPPSQLGAVARSDPAQPSPNIEWHVQPLSLDKFGDPLHRFAAITPSVCNLRPTSRGHVRLASNDPEAHPAIALNYLATPEDHQVAVDGMRFTRRIMAAPALARYRPMGHDAAAVVDARLRVHGIRGLRVIDASVMPRTTSGNTNTPTVMIAEKGPEMVVQDSRRANLG